MVAPRLPELHSADFTVNLSRFLVQGGMRNGDGFAPCKGKTPQYAANQIAARLLGSKFDSVLFIDSDAQWDVDILEKMRDLKEGQQFDMFGLFVTGRRWPVGPVWMKLKDGVDADKDPRVREGEFGAYYYPRIDEEKTEEIDAMGLHFTLVRRRVFEQTPRPWFYYPKTMVQGTEDIPFSQEAKKAGFKIGITSKLKVKHLGLVPWGWDEYQESLKEADQGKIRIPPKEWGFGA